MPRKNQAASANGRVARIQSASSAPRDQRADRERERHREQRVPRVEHRRVDHHARVAQQRVQARRPRPAPARRVANGVRVKTQQRGEERAEAEQHRGRVRRDLAQRAGASRNSTRLDHSDSSQHPQQQRALLRGPRRGGAVEGRRGRRGVRRRRRRSEKSERRNATSRITNATVVHAGQRVDRAAARRRPSRAARRARRRARRRCRRRADAEREDQAGLADDGHASASGGSAGSAVNFDGHLVTSESFSPTNVAPLLAHVDDDLAALPERVGHARRCSGPAPRRARRGRARGSSVRCRACAIEPSTTLPVSW